MSLLTHPVTISFMFTRNLSSGVAVAVGFVTLVAGCRSSGDQAPCHIAEDHPRGTPKENASFTADEVVMLASVFDEVMAPLFQSWDLDEEIVIALATHSVPAVEPPDSFLSLISRHGINAKAWHENERPVFICTLRLGAWIGADSAMVNCQTWYQEPGSVGSGRDQEAMAIRDGDRWRVCIGVLGIEN